jgi:hypothetical protein
MEGANQDMFRPTLSVWPAEPPSLPTVSVDELRRVPNSPDAFTAWPSNQATALAFPEDFCLRECLATSPDDLDDVFALISRWGRLSPSEPHLRAPLDSLPAGLDRLVPHLVDRAARAELRAFVAASPCAGQAYSLHVEAHYLRVLRAVVGHIVRAGNGQDPSDAWASEGLRDVGPQPWSTFVMTMNAALRPFSVHVRYPGADALLDRPSTYEVAVLQLAQLIAEERRVRTCANERCRRLFTRQRGRAKYDNTGHATGVIYCSNLCAKAQSERNRRARLRTAAPAEAAASET